MWSTHTFWNGLMAAIAISSSVFAMGVKAKYPLDVLQIPAESIEFSEWSFTSKHENGLLNSEETCSEGSIRPAGPADDWCNTCICIKGNWACSEAPCFNPNCKCGVANKELALPALRIIGGEEIVLARKYPWQVSLKYQNIHQCGGTIINDRWILTAAHCLFDITCSVKASSANPLKVAVGEHIHNDEGDNSHVTKDYSVKQYVPHPDFDCKTVKNDFGLLELTEPIPFDDIIRPICLPEDDSKDYAGETGTVIGWGQTTNILGTDSAILKELQLPIHGNNDCKQWNCESKFESEFDSAILDPVYMCAYLDSNEATCQGDSGGPLFVYENNRYVQVGIVSFGQGNETDLACDHPDYPSIYARVTEALDWIAKTTSSGRKCHQ